MKIVIKCNIKEEEFNFNTIEEARKFNRYNEITFFDCFNL